MRSRYGRAHRTLRARLLPLALGHPCPHCGELMTDPRSVDLDHTADGSGYRGIVHSSCNRREGAKRRQDQLKGRDHPGGVFR